MEEDIEMQIEQLRANRGKDRARKTEDEDDILLYDEEKPEKKDDGIMGVLLFQCIVAVIIAIAFALIMAFNRPVAADIKSVIIDKSQNDFSFKDKVYSGVSDILTYLNKLEPIKIDNEQTDALPIEDDEKESVPIEEDTSDPESQNPSSVPEDNPESTVSQAGAGGEPNPVLDGEIPSNATFAPVIFTGTITFPIKKDYRISSSFGFRDSPINKADEFHTALDIAADKGTPIMAAASGTVIKSEKGSSSLGNYIIIDHSNGFLTVYGHCDKLIAKEGAHIREGEIIARVGSTGASTGNHLHFGMKKDGLYFDPEYIFKEEAKPDAEV